MHLLSQYFLNKFRKQFGKDIRKISSYAMDILNKYDFPGNVRELEHIIERGVAMESSSIILPDSLTLSTHKKQLTGAPSPVWDTLPPEGIDLDQNLADFEKKMLLKALQQTQGVRLKAAELLGISFRSFRYRLIKYGLASEEE